MKRNHTVSQSIRITFWLQWAARRQPKINRNKKKTDSQNWEHIKWKGNGLAIRS